LGDIYNSYNIYVGTERLSKIFCRKAKKNSFFAYCGNILDGYALKMEHMADTKTQNVNVSSILVSALGLFCRDIEKNVPYLYSSCENSGSDICIG